MAYLLPPTLLSTLASLVKALTEWLDLTTTTNRLLGEELTGRAWAQIATSFAV